MRRRTFLGLPLLLPLWAGDSLARPELLRLTVRHPQIGVHTRLTDEVDPAKIDRTLDMVVAMGASWDVEYFPWSYFEPYPGVYDWSHPDIVVEGIARRGLTLVARIDLVPEWVRPANTTQRFLDPSGYEQYARAVAAFANRYSGNVDYIIVWNEPNTAFEWGYREPNAGEYVQMLQMVYPAVKAVNPAVKIVSAGLAATLATGGVALDDLTYLDELYKAGAAPYFDVLGAHAYGDIQPAQAAPNPRQLNFQRVVLQRMIMDQHGDGAKPVLISEAGWNDAPRWTHAVPPAKRIAYTIQAYEMAQDWSWLEALCMWVFRLPYLADTADDYFAFVEPDFTPRPIYEAVQQYAKTP